MLCRISFWTGKWSPAPLYCLVGAAEMMWNVASHLNMFASCKRLSHLSHLNPAMTWILQAKTHFPLFWITENHTEIQCYRHSYWFFLLPVSIEKLPWCIAEGGQWELTLYSLVARMTTAKRRGHQAAAAEGEMAALCFPLLVISARTICTIWNPHICTVGLS